MLQFFLSLLMWNQIGHTLGERGFVPQFVTQLWPKKGTCFVGNTNFTVYIPHGWVSYSMVCNIPPSLVYQTIFPDTHYPLYLSCALLWHGDLVHFGGFDNKHRNAALRLHLYIPMNPSNVDSMRGSSSQKVCREGLNSSNLYFASTFSPYFDRKRKHRDD